jgi:cytochrome c oxidase assembly factor CtaG
MSLGDWQLQPLPLAAAALALILYAKGWVRLRRRRRSLARPGAALAYGAGVLAATLAVVSPLDPLGEQKLLTAHMAQHLLLGDIAPLLIVAGLRGPMCFFLLPQGLLRSLARSRPLRRTLSFLLRPWVTLGVWVVVIYTWHIPWLYDFAIANPPLHDAEHATFVVVGLLVWTQIIDPSATSRLSPGRRALFATGVLVAGMPLSEILLVTGSIYPHYSAISGRPFGWSAANDQAHAGLLMMAEQIATLASAAALLLWTHVERLAELPGAARPPVEGDPLLR